MKRFIALVLALGLVFGAVASAEAAKKKKKVTRTAESIYEAPALGSGVGACLGATNSCGDLATGGKEYWVMVEITDGTGLDVYGTVGQDLDGDGTTDSSTTICGKSEEAIQIQPGVNLTVYPWAVGRPQCPGVATTGIVKATFSNLP